MCRSGWTASLTWPVFVLLALGITSSCGRPRDRDRGADTAHSQPTALPSPAGRRAGGEVLQGTYGASQEWKTGWLDLAAITDFRAGDTLELSLSGPAVKIMVRLLEQDASADSPTGVLGDAMPVPSGHVVSVVLPSDYPRIKQISVHGGPNPWGLFDLGRDNGGVVLLRARVRRVPAGASGL